MRRISCLLRQDPGNRVRGLGSFGHSFALWPISLQEKHRTFCSLERFSCSVLSVASWSSRSSSSSSSLLSCLENLHPRASRPRRPQHHHISPLNSEWWVVQDQLKFSLSTYSRPQFRHIFCSASNIFLLALYFLSRLRSLSRSSMRSFSFFSTCPRWFRMVSRSVRMATFSSWALRRCSSRSRCRRFLSATNTSRIPVSSLRRCSKAVLSSTTAASCRSNASLSTFTSTVRSATRSRAPSSSCIRLEVSVRVLAASCRFLTCSARTSFSSFDRELTFWFWATT
mmetsp:Transcript_73701/g.168967  ORF Transcript_73701/g.168967 Transcript_73701/m.168967 type:complete len:283 (+) Transcript_73701:484-1332(+)